MNEVERNEEKCENEVDSSFLQESNLNIIKNLLNNYTDIPSYELIPTLQEKINSNDITQLSYFLSEEKEITILQGELQNNIFSHTLLIQELNHYIQDNKDAYRKLKKINPGRIDKCVINNKALALKYLEKIYEELYISNNVIDIMENPNFRDIENLDRIYKKLIKLHNKYINQEVPEILEKMPKCFQQKQQKIKSLIDNFVINFTHKFIHKILLNQNEIVNISNNERMDITCMYIPNTNKTFSIDVTDFNILRVIYPYHKILFFIKENYSLYYDEIINDFLLSIRDSNEKEILKKVNVVNNKVESFLKSYQLKENDFEKSLEPNDEKSVFDQIEDIFNTLFSTILKETVVLKEFFNYDFQNKNVLSDNFQNDLFSLINNLSSFRIIYFLKIFKIFHNNQKCFQQFEKYLMRIFDAYIKKQINFIYSIQITQNKIYIVNSLTEDYIKYLLELIDYCDNIELGRFIYSFLNLIKEVINFIHQSSIFETQKLKKLLFVLINYYEIFDNVDKISFRFNEESLNSELQSLKDSKIKIQNKFLQELLHNYIHEPFLFFDKIDEWKSNHYFQDVNVLFQPTHTVKNFIYLQSHFSKYINDGLNSCFTFIKRTIKVKNIKKEIKGKIIDYIKDKIIVWNQISIKYYKQKVFETNIENIIKK